jgi:predicted lysophospholipase L1 biosynthesis ABC-type transport system permease subunit
MMRILREWRHRLGGTVRPGRRDEDLAEELRAHTALAAEAGRRAGGASQAMEALRDQRGVPWLDDLGRDSRYGLRTLARSRGFTATALISLALGIGANAGIFTLLDQILLRPLPVDEPQRLVQVDWSTGFGILALVISVVGLFGVMSFVATQRSREIGLRVALGATRRDAVWLVLRDALLMIAAGVAVALPAVWALRRFVETQLFGVTGFDGPTIAAAAAGLVLVALAAATLPAWRASRLDPNAALRVE